MTEMESPYTPPAAPLAGLPQPPSAKSSKTFGILGICSHLLCLLGAPFAILFGILALVRHGRAKREHLADPGAYAPPTLTGMVTGIVALVMLVTVLPSTGIVAAIAIPALLGQREKAKIRAVESLVKKAQDETMWAGARLAVEQQGKPVSINQIVRSVLDRRDFQFPQSKNPYGGTESPYRLGDSPANLGEVTLEPITGIQGVKNGNENKCVVIRGKFQKNGESIVVSKVVAFD